MATDNSFFEQHRQRLSLRKAAIHLLLLAVTVLTSTIAGTLYPFGLMPVMPDADPQTWPQLLQFIATLPSRYVALVATAVYNIATDAEYLRYGLSFSISLLFILISHEMGHYIACRIYKVDATLPFFIPTPPMIGPAGTFGAFIKILSPMPSRKAVFDIGVAGPIAGFIALMPVTALAIATMRFGTLADVENGNISPIVFLDPLFFKLVFWLSGFNPDLPIESNPFYFAAWVGLLVTALNLIPSGQLDGGHAIYAVLGEKVHYWTGRIAFVVMAALSVLGWFIYNSPSGFLIAVLLGIMMKIRHPQPWDEMPLDVKRKAVAFLTLVIFVLCFAPFPIRIS
jgi:membrane-associated protease RseP (regulator of RpoE activity)